MDICFFLYFDICIRLTFNSNLNDGEMITFHLVIELHCKTNFFMIKISFYDKTSENKFQLDNPPGMRRRSDVSFLVSFKLRRRGPH